MQGRTVKGKKYVKKKLLDKVEDECLVLHFVSFYQIHVSVVD